MSSVSNRSEILFIYHVKDANPNGDPLDENRPRTDPDTGVATVTDVRIKRTIRDYWFKNLELEILMRDTSTSAGFLKSGKQRAEAFVLPAGKKFATLPEAEKAIEDELKKTCIDVRCFGATLPLDATLAKPKAKTDGSVTLTGPVQFAGFSRSLHKVAPIFIQGTAGFASKEDKMVQKSFREDYLLPYACIACYGVVNEIAAKSTNMTDTDVELVLEGLWRGTENLISRSKMGHQPLLLLHIEYNDNYRIGDLASRISLVPTGEATGAQLRTTSEFKIDAAPLSSAIKKAGKNVSKIRCIHDDMLNVEGLDFEMSELEFKGGK